eukprot:g2640.t1
MMMSCLARIGSRPSLPQRRLRRSSSGVRIGRLNRPLRCASVQDAAPANNSSISLSSVILIDNYDSFTYNLSQYLGELQCDHVVVYNDEKSVHELKKMKPRGILISPGPGRPEDSGISMQVIEELGQDLPIMGVCMGLQCMTQVFGGTIIRSPSGVMHGKTSPVHHTNQGLLKGLPNPFLAARYHSLIAEKASLPDVLEITAWTEDGIIMGIKHKEYQHLQAVQFHPESIITDGGKAIIQNFINMLEE